MWFVTEISFEFLVAGDEDSWFWFEVRSLWGFWFWIFGFVYLNHKNRRVAAVQTFIGWSFGERMSWCARTKRMLIQICLLLFYKVFRCWIGISIDFCVFEFRVSDKPETSHCKVRAFLLSLMSFHRFYPNCKSLFSFTLTSC